MAEWGRQVFSALELGPGCLVLGIELLCSVTFLENLTGFSVRAVVERTASLAWYESSFVA